MPARGKTSRRGSGRSTGPKRAMRWLDTHVSSQVVAGSQLISSLLGGVDLRGMEGSTLVRTLIDLAVIPATLQGSLGAMLVDLAIGLVEQDAFAVSEVPDPQTAGDQPIRGWVWKCKVTETSSTLNTPPAIRCQADIRAMRKIGTGELVLILNSALLTGTTHNTRVQGLIRTLWKLP